MELEFREADHQRTDSHVVYTFANEPSYDTMLQQARWCGYRTTPTSTYADLVRIFTESQIHNQFHTISLAELDLRSQLEAMDDDVDPIEQRIFIQRHDGFKITGRMPPV